jgi:sigma-B regulation protein RsbU (phosphoserine phosphatase)
MSAAAKPQDWEIKLAHIIELVRDMSRHTDPQEMVRSYAAKVNAIRPVDGRISLSRRGLHAPEFRITRSTRWKEDINPWKQKSLLPVFQGGVLADLLYSDTTQVFDNLTVSEQDPAYAYLQGYQSLLAIPMFDAGVSLNMVVLLRKEPHAFRREDIPEIVWMSNLFGRATNNLVLSAELQRAYEAIDHELKVVADIQRSLLPVELPQIATLDLAAYYRPSQRAGGDYYDFFPLPNDQWGIFIADVSGHGTPAAVLMALTHCIAHTFPGSAQPPSQLLRYLNQHLTRLYTTQNSHFITAYYGIYDSRTRTLTYACAGHNPPRLKRCQDGTLQALDQADGLPLGILADAEYTECVQQLQTGDQIIFYTDGITEAANTQGELFGTQRMDTVLGNCSLQAASLLKTLLASVEEFAEGQPADDDRTIVVARVR